LIQIVSAAEGFALAGAAGVILLQALDCGAALEFRRTLLAAEPWRLLTGHLVHSGWRHALLNSAAWIALARLFGRELGPARQAVVLAACMLGTSLLLWQMAPAVSWYRGLSGALHGLCAAGAVLWLAQPQERNGSDARHDRILPALLLAGILAKVLIEQRGAAPPWMQNWIGVTVITQSHLFGAAIGTAAGGILSFRQPENIES